MNGLIKFLYCLNCSPNKDDFANRLVWYNNYINLRDMRTLSLIFSFQLTDYDLLQKVSYYLEYQDEYLEEAKEIWERSVPKTKW